MLKLEKFTKIYSNKKIGADKLDLHVEAGDMYAFIGPNGSGKTTTIKCIVGASEITSGAIYINERNIATDAIACKSAIAYVPDNPDIYTTLTGAQFLDFVAGIYRIDKDKKAELVEKYAKLWDIWPDLQSPISNYSHGMRQKLVLISGIIREPKLLVLDEPFVGLDPVASKKLKDFMREFCEKGGAVFYSTHVLEVAEKLCNKVAIIKDGKIVTSGTMDQVKKDKSLEQIFFEI